MATRSKTVMANRTQIQRAVVYLAKRERLTDITLASIARSAGLSVRTLLRQYGSKDNLLRSVAERPATPDDVGGALEALGRHYESTGRLMRPSTAWLRS